ncbi:MAG TPA: nucleoside-diphosphate sugar epimerase/dehydratase [Chthonomonadaceae bacterium]|nr:nucleoside-diphosphate sugar epimerase/dehydratase [Chthonomonadaceae bacterium]
MSTLLASIHRVKAIRGWMKTPLQGLDALWNKLRNLVILFWRRATLCICDTIFTTLSCYLGLALQQESLVLSPTWMRIYVMTLIPLLALRLCVLTAFGVYRIVSRHVGIRDMAVIGLATLVSSLLFWFYLTLENRMEMPVVVLFSSLCLNFLLIAGSRLVYRMLFEHAGRQRRRAKAARLQRVVIVGAGGRGAALAHDLKVRGGGSFVVVGFLDDDPSKRKLLINGIPVLGTSADMQQIATTFQVDLVVIAISAATGKLIRRITQSCDGLKLKIQIAPDLSAHGSGSYLHILRNVSVEDLLQRESVHAEGTDIGSYLRGERVLITGAGGSIGSELVRQVVAQHPAAIFLLGHGENSLFEIEQELKLEVGFAPTCLIADIRDYERLFQLFMKHRPTVVFHAAAHKHVGLMENNPEEAVTNNVLGTRNLARISTLTRVKRFVMISTDKAVNPTSVMGATKRIAERVVQAESRRSATEFACVRFGNVLGSRGSVVPLMRKQIARGGPVTVTHPDIVRYFMTIPEAVQLVLHAGAMGGQGAIYLLDMGEPVRILDLAHDLIRLSGLTPERDIAIEFTGLRPGEKLYEELLTAEEGAKSTQNQRIYTTPPAQFSIEALDLNVAELIAAAQSGDTQSVLERIWQFDLTTAQIAPERIQAVMLAA